MQRVFLMNKTGLTPDKTALLAPATKGDTALLGGSWLPIDEIAVGEQVTEVNQVGQNLFRVGETLEVTDVNHRRPVYVTLLSMRLTRGPDLTDEEIRRLGYDDRQAYMDDWGSILTERVWYMEIEHIIPGDGSLGSQAVQ